LANLLSSPINTHWNNINKKFFGSPILDCASPKMGYLRQEARGPPYGRNLNSNPKIRLWPQDGFLSMILPCEFRGCGKFANHNIRRSTVKKFILDTSSANDFVKAWMLDGIANSCHKGETHNRLKAAEYLSEARSIRSSTEPYASGPSVTPMDQTAVNAFFDERLG
jgi:hypothetical protein